jgi:hypothetical protein
MNDRQENKVGMIRTTGKVLNDNNAEYAAIPALVAQVANLDASLGLIDQLVQAQQSDTSGITLDKKKVLEQMIDKALQVAGALKAWASEQSDNTLQTKADITRSSFLSVRDEKRDDVAQEIHNLANTHIVALAPYGITAATLTALQTRIDAYQFIVVGPQHAKAQRTTITQALDDEINRASMLLNDRIDGLVEPYKASGTTFYADYQNARKIIDNAGGGTPPAPPAPPAPPGP